MATREEIRENLLTIISGVKGKLTPENAVRFVLSYLHSQGVVIKVERELPKIVLPVEGTGEEIFLTETIGGYYKRHGYVAVEPLI